MINLSRIVYKRNFLSSVLCRVDFFNSLADEQVQDNELHRIIMNYYPRKGMSEIVRLNHFKLNVSDKASDFTEDKQNLLQITFSSSVDRNTVRITNSSLLFEIKDYNKFSNLFSVYSDIVNYLYLKDSVIVRRIGLRYINTFDRNNFRLFKSYFAPSIGFALEKRIVDHDDSFVFTRSMHRAEYMIDDMQLLFNYGINNRAYPNEISDNSEFVLDYDCFKEAIIDKNEDALQTLRQAHANIQTLFEATITLQLRKIMEISNE